MLHCIQLRVMMFYEKTKGYYKQEDTSNTLGSNVKEEKEMIV